MKAATESPPKYELKDDVEEGVYLFVNKASRTILDLAGGRSEAGTPVQGHERRNQWFATRWALQHRDEAGAWIVTNLMSATFLDIRDGRTANGSPVAGWPDANQRWLIQHRNNGFYSVQNAQCGTSLELRSMENGTPSTCSTFVEGHNEQLWALEKGSRTVQEIIRILGDWNEALLTRLSHPHSLETHCVLLPDDMRKSVWEGSGLRTQLVRPQVFDQDQFVIKAKEAVISTFRDQMKSNGYGVLFGIVYGQAKRGPNAYNWYLTSDLEHLVFFDPQNGMEYTTTTLDKRGFKPSFVLF